MKIVKLIQQIFKNVQYQKGKDSILLNTKLCQNVLKKLYFPNRILNKKIYVAI